MRHIIGALRRVKPAAFGDDTESLDVSLLLGADLGLSSLELVWLAGALQRELGWLSIGFHRLFINADGSFAADVSISRSRLKGPETSTLFFLGFCSSGKYFG